MNKLISVWEKVFSSERCTSTKYKINVIISANGIWRVGAIWLKNYYNRFSA